MTLYAMHRLILQMNRALGMFEAQKQTLAAGVSGAIFRAPVTKWATREEREGQLSVVSLCGYSC